MSTYQEKFFNHELRMMWAKEEECAKAPAVTAFYIVDTSNRWIVSMQADESWVDVAEHVPLTHGISHSEMLAATTALIREISSQSFSKVTMHHINTCFELAMGCMLKTLTYERVLSKKADGKPNGHWMYIAYKCVNGKYQMRPYHTAIPRAGLMSQEDVIGAVQEVIQFDLMSTSNSLVSRAIKDNGGPVIDKTFMPG